MKNKIEDLRDHLFETIEALKDKDDPMDIDRAKAIKDVAQTVINSAVVEVKAMELLGGVSSEFFPSDDRKKLPSAEKPRLVR